TLPPGYNRLPPATSSYNRTTPAAPGFNRSSSMAPNSRRDLPNQAFHSTRPDQQKQSSATASTPSSKLERLSESDRAFLIKQEGCFRCRKTYANHFWRDCGGDNSVKNKGLAREVKQEANFISEAAEEYQFEESEDCHVVPPIVLPIQLNDQVHAQGLIDSGSSASLISTEVIKRNPSS